MIFNKRVWLFAAKVIAVYVLILAVVSPLIWLGGILLTGPVVLATFLGALIIPASSGISIEQIFSIVYTTSAFALLELINSVAVYAVLRKLINYTKDSKEIINAGLLAGIGGIFLIQIFGLPILIRILFQLNQIRMPNSILVVTSAVIVSVVYFIIKRQLDKK